MALVIIGAEQIGGIGIVSGAPDGGAMAALSVVARRAGGIGPSDERRTERPWWCNYYYLLFICFY